MMRFVMGLAALALAGCTAQDLGLAPPEDGPITRALAGKTLTLDGAPEFQVTFAKDGTISGFAEGRWSVTDGAYCRTLTGPPGMAGTECPVTELSGDTVTFTSSTGRSTWRISPAPDA
ncbi:hypothetical protein PVW48_18835 [Dinoroseobacter sp. PD6]|uniref:hypothetical protein n=1 Tax=Dinoroseobacter sp. PD6 TaxID=3028384 RepID=UPI00237C0B3C|nr:hypothetical protein [Dinoroseobacter sp. PD6]MDD9718820.1 hypothetical protein [Dinoroseobacter sp. PD6]